MAVVLIIHTNLSILHLITVGLTLELLRSWVLVVRNDDRDECEAQRETGSHYPELLTR